ncbi:MAG: hypothetical protein ACOX41_00660 [Anaerovoracaceae bacterium]|jgi:hypothetical protein
MAEAVTGTNMAIEIDSLDDLRVMVEDMPEGTVISISVGEVMSDAAKERE